MSTAQGIIELILIFILPPLAVFLQANECSGHVILNILLTLLGWIPGAIHAAWYCYCRGLRNRAIHYLC
ncbi:hypothetical protein M3Y97_00195900 [Aphelenchoides bicaudatus]|nr:hypothetical protein M3Y97_00195900 [Aphelenchoides bicaudatus]